MKKMIDLTFENLVLAHLPLVEKIANKLNFSHNEEVQKELISIGHEALCMAALQFDPEHGSQFASLAYSYIKGKMLNAINRGKEGLLRESDFFTEYDEETYLDRPYCPEEASWRQVDTLLQSSRLTPREEDVVRSQFGIDCPPSTTREIAEHYGLTVQMINHIKRGALAKMRLAA